MLLLVGDQAGEEGKQHHRVAQVSVVVLQRLQGCLSQNFIHCLKVVESHEINISGILTILEPSGLNVWVL